MRVNFVNFYFLFKIMNASHSCVLVFDISKYSSYECIFHFYSKLQENVTLYRCLFKPVAYIYKNRFTCIASNPKLVCISILFEIMKLQCSHVK